MFRSAGGIRLVPVLAVLAFAGIGVALINTSGRALLYVDDLAQLAAPLLASGAAIWAARRHAGRSRAAWMSIAVATGGWGSGQLIWCWHELLRDRATPFPSVADVGFLTFAVAAPVGLLVFPPRRGRHDRARWFLDSCTVVCALVTVSWSTALGAVAHGGGDSTFAFVVSLAYPIGDILVLSMAISALCRPGAMVRELGVLSAAMVAMAVADSGFTYLTATGSYETGGQLDLGWVAAFALLGLAAWDSARRSGEGAPHEASTHQPAAVTMLPYLPVLAAAAVVGARIGLGNQLDSVQVIAMSATFGLVLVRQYLTVKDNRGLVDTLAAREAQLQHQAFFDLLTGLANRALFTDRVEHALDLHRRDHRPIAVLFCDLDDFKTVNDTLGHGAGDQLLQHMAHQLRAALRPGDTVARLGGDEFAVLLEHGDGVRAVAERVVETLAESVEVAGLSVTVQGSVGLAQLAADEPTVTVDELLARADIAMYAAKRSGKGGLAEWEAGMMPPHGDDLRLRQPLTAAVVERRIGLAYQPIVRLDGTVLGFEALARWSLDGTPVPPDRFLPVAQRAGLLHGLTEHVVDEATAQLARWSAQLGSKRLRIGVNVPALLMTDEALPEYVARAIDRNQLQPEQLVVEITEDALAEDFEAVRRIALRLRDVGARLCVDDFGKGYSSLGRLQRIPLHSLKIDKEFTKEIDRSPEAERFVAALLALSTDLGLVVVAEGVERAGQARVLRKLGCQLAQGYLFARPQPADAVDPAAYYSIPAAAPPARRREPQMAQLISRTYA